MPRQQGEADQPGAKTAAEFRAMDNRVQHANGNGTGKLVKSPSEQERGYADQAGGPTSGQVARDRRVRYAPR